MVPGGVGSIKGLLHSIAQRLGFETGAPAEGRGKEKAEKSAAAPADAYLPPDILIEPDPSPELRQALAVFEKAGLLDRKGTVVESGSLGQWLGVVREARERGMNLANTAGLLSRRVVVTRNQERDGEGAWRKRDFSTPASFIEGRNAAAGLGVTSRGFSLDRLFGTAQGDSMGARRLALFYKEALGSIAWRIGRFLEENMAGRPDSPGDRETAAALVLALETLSDEAPEVARIVRGLERENVSGIEMNPDGRGGRILHAHMSDPLSSLEETIDSFVQRIHPTPDDAEVGGELISRLAAYRAEHPHPLFAERGTDIRERSEPIDFDFTDWRTSKGWWVASKNPVGLSRLHRALRKVLWGTTGDLAASFRWDALPDGARMRPPIHNGLSGSVRYLPAKDGKGEGLSMAFRISGLDAGWCGIGELMEIRTLRFLIEDEGKTLAARVSASFPDREHRVFINPRAEEDAQKEASVLLEWISQLFSKPLTSDGFEVTEETGDADGTTPADGTGPAPSQEKPGIVGGIVESSDGHADSATTGAGASPLQAEGLGASSQLMVPVGMDPAMTATTILATPFVAMQGGTTVVKP